MADNTNTNNISSDPKITVRKAELEDYESVLDINRNIYDGLDYIPDYYHEMIKDTDFHFYVAEVDGTVAAFEAVILLDDAMTLMGRAARVNESFKGMGLLRVLRQKINQDFQGVATLKRYRLSCTNVVRLVHSKTFNQENKTLLRRELEAMSIKDKDSIIPVNGSQGEAMHISLEQFSHLLLKKPLNEFLFPHGIFTVVSWFFDTLPSNMKYLEKLYGHVIISKPLFCHLPSAPAGEVEKEEKVYSGLLGIGSHYFCSLGLFYHIDFFGTPTKGQEGQEYFSLIRHFVTHLLKVLETRQEMKTIMLGSSRIEGTPKEWITDALSRFGFRVIEELSAYQFQYYYEQDFRN